MPAPSEFLSYIDSHADQFIARLAESVAIPSVSSDAKRRGDVVKMAHWLSKQLSDVGVENKLVPLGKQVMDGVELDLPPAILGKLGEDPKKKTVLIYGHFDVQPANKSDGWNTEPFELYIHPTNGQLIGRGSTDDKGPIMGWLNVLQAHKELGIEFPVNFKFCFEGMEENGSEGLDALIKQEASGYFSGVDCVCISDNYWLNDRTPCITYGLRGIAAFNATVSGPGADLHSGVFGGTVHEPMTDLIHILSKLTASDGSILVPGVKDMVPRPDAEEHEIFDRLDYSIADLDKSVGASITFSDNKVSVLMGRMREPSLSLHGIEGAFYGSGVKTVIPAKVSGKFSIRLVPPQTPQNIEPLVVDYLNKEFAKLGSKNKLVVQCQHGGKPWLADIKHWNYEAAIKATLAVYNQVPDLTREGGSIPVTLTFADALGVSVLLLPMGRGDDGAHSTNEKLDKSNFIEGTKLLGTYLHEIGAIN